ncbi:DUF952 domain-containing protein [Marinobacter sp. NFXS9]|uniref:DUF952 domain-containing protein n=1 Tax=Marinobacter sp. NFXS9 TaxID=2818433 RepID=UPI0032E014C4
MDVRNFYRVLSAKTWGDAHRCGVIEPCGADRRAGLIHLSTRDLVERMAARHFRASEFPVAVELDADYFRDDLEWCEPTTESPWRYPMLRRPHIEMNWVIGVHLLLFAERDGEPRCTMKEGRLDWAL